MVGFAFNHDKVSVMQYRREIDGLRALAVIPVIFHAGFEAFSGGFVSVDVFLCSADI
ncbi:MAG: hypothetical protein IPN04_05080 [Rhodoferax sp.]|nr:hypothetical protein [Rhodoferax sp.]